MTLQMQSLSLVNSQKMCISNNKFELTICFEIEMEIQEKEA